ncbi:MULTISPECIES: ComEA family DNA-binding protein [Pseudoalteromonas]|uniref:Helix-hairpin-helix DNA-binding motif class 1 domain-containing protein n=1 Tax=Pseudoalteromonas ruthenica TaxID=151081 RepID=A0A0F4PLM2_9GAMM|nr:MULTISPECIES: ComEA family DNA-binding protein [Pseudoalteromonas]KJY96054.1 hypothetical protein TW76_12805 [Pseudoalteromonas ruthenica]KJY96795.1 hypothetical protein TW72_16405 [Pseudoalteromonas ruthenica]MCF2863532.1 ComEA family DNA-binding protein [Pseudoalteromonas sp. CNAT2-18]MCG7558485.1 ComEA family DNA-binding protein [Pseudoalteromonas sp. CNAT2-18.1]TMO91463.1 competence protein ComEA [Pseudoalteromonas ruthenica]
MKLLTALYTTCALVLTPAVVAAEAPQQASEQVTPAKLDINQASEEQLQSLPGIGPTKAAAIIEYRQVQGNFRSVDELDAVPGIGASTLAQIRELVKVR